MKKGGNSTIMTVLLSVTIILLCGLIFFVVVQDGKKTSENTQENTNTTSYKPWMNYILEQDITKIELSKYDCDGADTQSTTIDTNKLKDIFNSFLKYDMRVSYTNGAGWSCGNVLNIKYLKNGKEYELMFVPNYFIPTSSDDDTILDKDLESALDNSVDIKDEDTKDFDDVYSHYDLVTDFNILHDLFE